MLEGAPGTTVPSQVRLATDTVSLETWGWGQGSCGGINISSCLWKKQMLQVDANTVAQGDAGDGGEFPEQTTPNWTSGWLSPPQTI